MNSENICTDRLADVSDQTSGLIKLWASLIGGILLCASTHVVAQACEAELSALLSVPVLEGGYQTNLEQGKIGVNQNLWDGGDFRDLGLGSCGVRCSEFTERRVIKPDHPRYREALLLFSEIYEKDGYSAHRSAQRISRLWVACVARHMAATLKPKRKYQ